MKNELMKYIPKEYKKFVVDIYEGEKEYNDITKKWNTKIVVEWKNEEISTFENKSWMRVCLKEFHAPDEYGA